MQAKHLGQVGQVEEGGQGGQHDLVKIHFSFELDVHDRADRVAPHLFALRAATLNPAGEYVVLQYLTATALVSGRLIYQFHVAQLPASAGNGADVAGNTLDGFVR